MFTARLASLVTGLLLLVLLPAAQSQAAEQQRRIELSSAEISEAEQRLSDLGYWAGPIDGRMDPVSRHALIAFQKVEGRERTGRLSGKELLALKEAQHPTARETGAAHIEIDIARQVLFYVDETGSVTKILPVSTGHGRAYNENGHRGVARTPCGTFHVYRKINGWRRSALGLLYYPCYIVAGFAIHGSPSVPAFPASHGCIRIPMFAAAELSKLATVGMVVIVYNGPSS